MKQRNGLGKPNLFNYQLSRFLVDTSAPEDIFTVKLYLSCHLKIV